MRTGHGVVGRTAEWSSDSGYQADRSCTAFLFSLTNAYRHGMSYCSHTGDGIHAAISSSGHSWPSFGGGHDFNLGSDNHAGYVGLGNTYVCRVKDSFDDSVCAAQ